MNIWELTSQDLGKAAETLGLESSVLMAVVRVESAGSGFLEPGLPKILFEGHIFWRELRKRGSEPETFAAEHASIVYPRWTKEHYRGGRREYDRLHEASLVHRQAALCSASWGAFQIMGFNHGACGFTEVEDFVVAQARSATGQLEAFCAFLRSQGLIAVLKQKDWAGFARRYNGPEYRQNRYDTKLASAYEKCRESGA